MSESADNPADVEHRLWNEIETSPVGMLMIVGGPPHHAQPMNAFVERESRRIWFFASNDSNLALEAAVGHPAMFIYQHRDIQACIGGGLAVQHDRARIDKYWNAVVAAYFPGGKGDPKLTLLRLDCDDAQVWLSSAGPMKFIWEIAKANATHRQPEVGGRTHLDFH